MNSSNLVVCFRKDTLELEEYINAFRFIGFTQLTQEEVEEQIAYQKTHLFYQYSLIDDEDY